MMEQVFLRILETGIAAGGVIVLVLLLCMVLKKAPRMVSYVLWVMVFLRLACPVEFASPVGLMPSVRLEELLLGGAAGEGKAGGDVKNTDGVSGEAQLDVQEKMSGETVLEGQGGTINQMEPEGQGGTINQMEPEGRGNATARMGQEGSTDQTEPGEQGGIPVRMEPEGQQDAFGFGKGLLWAGTVIWIVGVLAMGFYGVYQAVMLKRLLAGSARWAGREADRIFLSDQITVPFVFGLFQPAVYLPADLTEESRSYVLLHEQTHIRHRDYLVKYAAYVLLCLYWFQPLVWLAYWMLERNMEFACDESVVARLEGEKKEYSRVLLELSAGCGSGKGGQRLPVAFSEKNTKSRIQNILQYRRPGRAAVVLLGVLVFAAAVCFMTNRKAGQIAAGDVTMLEQEDSTGIPCIIANEDGDFIGTKRFGQVQAVELEYPPGFPKQDQEDAKKDSAGENTAAGYAIRENTFAGCGKLEQITVPRDDIEYVAEDAFAGCADNLLVYCNKDTYLQKRLEEIGVAWMDLSAAGQEYHPEPHMIMTQEGEVLAVSQDLIDGAEDISFPPETRVIGETALCNCTVNGTVTIPAEVTEIKASAFSNTVMGKVVFEGNKLKKIGEGAFVGVQMEEEIRLPEGLEEIGKNAFVLTSLKKLTLPSSMKRIGESPFGILQSITVCSRDVEYYGDHILFSAPEQDAGLTVHCYQGSTTEAYIQSHVLDTKLQYLDETEASGEAGTATGQDITLEDSPWKIRWQADVTADGVSDEIVVYRPWDIKKKYTAKQKEVYQVDVMSGASGKKLWSYKMDGSVWVMMLGLYDKDGKTYLMEKRSEYRGKEPDVIYHGSYQVFQLDEQGKKIFYDKDSLKYPSDQWEKYKDRDNKINQKANSYMKESDLIIKNISGSVVCSVPLQRRNMYGFSDESTSTK